MLTSRMAARSFAGGSRSPGFASPSAIARRISAATCSYRSVESPLSTLTFIMVLVTLSQSCRTCSCDRHCPASPASPGRSRRPRGARGPRRGADRGGEEARPAQAAHLRGCRDAGGTRRSHGLHGLRAQRTVAECFPCALRTVQPSRRNDKLEARFHQDHALRVLWPWPHRALRDERRREREAEADARRVRGVRLVARRAEDRLPSAAPASGATPRQLEIYVINADGSGERRLTRNAGKRLRSCLVARRAEIAFGRGDGPHSEQIYVMNADGSGQRRLTRLAADNSVLAWLPDGKIAFVSSHGPQRLRDLRHERRRQRTAEPDPRVGARRLSGLVARRAEDRLREQARRQLGDLRHERRRHRAAEADPQPSERLRLLPGRPTGGRSSSDATATAGNSDDIYVINADGSGQQRLTQGGRQPSGRQTGRRSPSEASATATTTSTS